MRPDLAMARLRAIRDPRLRTRTLAQALGEGEPTTWVHVLAAVMTRAHVSDDPDAAEALEDLTHAAAAPSLTYETRQRLYEAAVQERLPSVGRLFLSASPETVARAQVARALAPERAIKPTGRSLTLGERKALARTHDREQLLLLIRDPHPAVVEILLGNPHLTEPDAVRIAASRAAVPAALSAIAAHPRWSVRHAVKRALVLNPATPLADAIRLATTLRTRLTVGVLSGLGFAGFFLKELVIANLKLAAHVLAPFEGARPGIIGFRLEARSDLEITLLANFITLTPGSLSLALSPDRRTLYVHAMFTRDLERLRRDLREGFERRLLEILR